MNPWTAELLVARSGRYDGGELRTMSRDVEHGRLHRLRPGVCTAAAVWDGLDPLGRHVLSMRALAAVANRPVVFGTWSAAVVHELPILGRHLDAVHVIARSQQQRGDRRGVVAHALPFLDEELVRVGGLLLTSAARTVVDLAATATFREAVAADGALRAHLPREVLDRAVDLAGGRRGRAKIAQVTTFAHPGRESAAESETGCTMYFSGIEPPVLQQRFFAGRRFVGRTDTWFPRVRGVGEIDGAKKLLAPRLTVEQSKRALLDEKHREDDLRALVDGFARWGWVESRDARLLLPVLARLGVRPQERRPTLQDWGRLSREARPTPLPRGFRLLSA